MWLVCDGSNRKLRVPAIPTKDFDFFFHFSCKVDIFGGPCVSTAMSRLTLRVCVSKLEVVLAYAEASGTLFHRHTSPQTHKTVSDSETHTCASVLLFVMLKHSFQLVLLIQPPAPRNQHPGTCRTRRPTPPARAPRPATPTRDPTPGWRSVCACSPLRVDGLTGPVT